MQFVTNARSFGASPAFSITFTMTPEEVEKCFELNQAELLRAVATPTRKWDVLPENERLTLCARLAELALQLQASELEGIAIIESKGRKGV